MGSAGSFFKFTLGFLTFISVSLVLTLAMNIYENTRSLEQQAAAAIKAMVEVKGK